ncbi:tRNA (N6-threonylcarbamoyladenosine(37)-N6)-methyltransferase TrmO [Pontiellaceae bacterium B12219]|nr:tRNA (N6-threonylcarbamoyladenosine(37)-N6)-methyltransferase TrmO [Pontiellaceae bacterium B12219]
MNFEFKPIGMIRSCYTDKFGIPRQPGLVKSATATLEMLPPFNQPEAFRGLEEFSHVWISFVFHQSASNAPLSQGSGVTGWKATVRPPRLGGNERVGVFASRSNFRPNPIGLSVVELLEVNGTELRLGGGDFLDQTPVLDIKPYIPYSDSIPDATGAFAAAPPRPGNTVSFLPEIEQKLKTLETEARPNLRQLICDMLSFNPRPAYQRDNPDRLYGTTVFDLEVRWKQIGTDVTVVAIK